MGKRYRFDAFISYRHCQPDSEIAQQLQKKLENFRLPKAITEKIGKKRPLRIFRDETELSVADDLSDVITTAIWESKYLICVCSPAYLESVWCMKEIEAFLRFNDRKHILLVLADGEPDTAFPEVLLYEEIFQMGPDGHPQRFRQYKEPLAADCRGDSSKERKANTDNAVVRLVSGIRGLPYEELAQRHRKEAYNRARNRVLAAFGVLLAIIAVGAFFLVRISRQKAQISRQQDELQAQKDVLQSQKDEIEEQKNTIQQKYADSMAGISENLLRDGKRKDAVYAARSVLPDNPQEGFSEVSLKALSGALGIYEVSDTVTSDDTIQFPCTISNYSISPFGGYALVLSLDGNNYVMDISTGKILLTFPDLNYLGFGFDGDRGFVFQREDENYTYLDFASGTETALDIADAKILSDPFGNGYAAVTDEEVMILKGTDVICRLVFSESLPAEVARIRYSTYVDFSYEGNEAWIWILDFDSGTTYAFKADLISGTVQHGFTDHSEIYDIRSDGTTMLCMQGSSVSGRHMCLRDLKTGTEKKCDNIDAFEGFNVFGDDVVWFDAHTIHIMDRDLEEKKTIRSDEDLSSSLATADGIFVFGSGDGGYLIRDGECLFIDPDVQDNKLVWTKVFANGTLFIAVTGETQINTFSFRRSDHMIPYSDSPVKFQSNGLDDKPAKDAFESFILEEETDFSQDMIYEVLFCENADIAAVQLWDGELFIYKRSTGERIKSLFESFDYSSWIYFDKSGECYYIDTYDGVEVFDKDFHNISRIPECYLIGYDPATGHPVVSSKNPDDLNMFMVMPVSYEELITAADGFLSNYEPDQQTKAKYGLS